MEQAKVRMTMLHWFSKSAYFFYVAVGTAAGLGLLAGVLCALLSRWHTMNSSAVVSEMFYTIFCEFVIICALVCVIVWGRCQKSRSKGSQDVPSASGE